jgi:DNA-binding transcriptional regulator YhcF (GntR family)
METIFTIRHSAALVSAIELLISTKMIKSGPGRTLQAIALFWNPQGQIYPSQQKLALMTGVARRTIITHIQALTDAGIITTSARFKKHTDGTVSCASLNYAFVQSKLGELFAKARLALKKAAVAAAKSQKKDHIAPLENDHTISSTEHGPSDVKITVRSALLDWFKSQISKALQSESNHQGAIAKKAAYNAATERNRIARGQAFSPEEQKRRKAIADAVRPEREKAASTAERIIELSKALLTWTRSKTGFDKAQHAELMTLTANGAYLDIATKIAAGNYSAAAN